MDRTRVAVIGAGYWGINYVRVFGELSNSRVGVVCDSRQDRLDEVSRRFPVERVTLKLQDALGSDVDAVVVATPATTHAEVVREALLAGKHVLVEKPITTTSDEAYELLKLAEAKGVKLMVGHTFIYNPGVQKVRTYIENGSVGRLYYLFARRTNLGPIRHDVNALWDLAPHDIAVFNYWLGMRPEWVSAVSGRVLRNGRADVGFTTMGYPQGILAHVHVSWADPNKVREMTVVGSERRIVFDDLNPMERVRVFEKGVSTTEEASSFGEYQFLMRDGDIISPKVEASEPLKNQGMHFLDCVRNGTQPITGAQEGLEIVKIMEAIDLSTERQGAPVRINWEPAPAEQPVPEGELSYGYASAR